MDAGRKMRTERRGEECGEEGGCSEGGTVAGKLLLDHNIAGRGLRKEQSRPRMNDRTDNISPTSRRPVCQMIFALRRIVHLKTYFIYYSIHA